MVSMRLGSLGIVAALAMVAVSACGDDDDGGTGGSAGSAGAAVGGTGGVVVTGGTGGVQNAGAAGESTGGAAGVGQSGAPGNAGVAGSAGGTFGGAGAAGAGNLAGSAGAAGAGGAASGEPYAIGHASQTLTRPTAIDIPVHIYYPAVAAGNDTAVVAGAFPLVVFGHGYQQSYLDYQYLWEALVPRGYIVVLPNRLSSTSPLSTDAHAADLAFLVDAMHGLNADSGSSFYQHVAAPTALMGHSTGGGADYIAAAGLTSVTTVASLAALGVVQPPNVTGTDPTTAAPGVTVPTLVLAGGADCITPTAANSQALYSALPGPAAKYLVVITQGDHCGYADVNGPGRTTCETAELARCGLPAPTTIAPATQNGLTADLVVPWLEYQLGGDAAGWTTFQNQLTDGRLSVTHN
jgi:hypothetical protein